MENMQAIEQLLGYIFKNEKDDYVFDFFKNESKDNLMRHYRYLKTLENIHINNFYNLEKIDMVYKLTALINNSEYLYAAFFGNQEND